MPASPGQVASGSSDQQNRGKGIALGHPHSDCFPQYPFTTKLGAETAQVIVAMAITAALMSPPWHTWKF